VLNIPVPDSERPAIRYDNDDEDRVPLGLVIVLIYYLGIHLVLDVAHLAWWLWRIL
jgi:hypothetical protein